MALVGIRRSSASLGTVSQQLNPRSTGFLARNISWKPKRENAQLRKGVLKLPLEEDAIWGN